MRRGRSGWWLLLGVLLASCSDPRSCIHTASCPAAPNDGGAPPEATPGAEPEPAPDDGSIEEANDAASLGPANIPTLSPGHASAPTDGQQEPTGSPTHGEGDGGATGDHDGGMQDNGGLTDDRGIEDDSGVDAGEPELEIPERDCAESPEDPENGAYVECDVTLDGETCELICETNYVKDGDTTCTEGEWSTQTCVRLGSLTATIGDAEDGSDIEDATVYVKGFYDPETEDCAASAFCRTTDANGEVCFDDFPSGEQQVGIVKEGYDEIALPIVVAPASDETVRLEALPTGFLSGNIVLSLSWGVGGNLDLVLNVPTTAGECVHFDELGALDAEPFAQLDMDARSSTTTGPETIRIAPSDAESGPYYDGTYSVLVTTGFNPLTLQVMVPTVRVIRESETGAADVQLFRLPEDAVEDATEWHVFDMDGDGIISEVGTTEALGDNKSDSELVCITEL